MIVKSIVSFAIELLLHYSLIPSPTREIYMSRRDGRCWKSHIN